MQELSKSVKTHYIVFKDKTEKPIYITRDQSDVIKNAMSEWYSTFIEIMNEEKTRSLFSWIVGIIEQIKEVKQTRKILYGYCNHGVRHSVLSDGWFDCDCQNEYGFFFDLYNWLKEKWYYWTHTEDIKEEWRKEYLKSKKKSCN